MFNKMFLNFDEMNTSSIGTDSYIVVLLLIQVENADFISKYIAKFK
jgi:hypothetical protein